MMGAEPVVEVVAKTAFFYQQRQIPMGGKEKPRVGGFCDIRAQREVLVLIEKPQQLYLRGQTEIPISSRKTVPPAAFSICPPRTATASVKAPLT